MNSKGRTFFSIITPVFNPESTAFEKCIDSVLAQTYPDWEWCLVDDCSVDKKVWRKLEKVARQHKNVKLDRRNLNGGIARASNDAISMATGEYFVFLDHDDELDRDALAIVNHELFLDSTIDLLYSDEDKISLEGEYVLPFRKPDWSPERLLCQNYCSHLMVVRSALVHQVGGLRTDFDGAQDHDLLLRISDQPIKVRHINRILYHWRESNTSTAMDANAKPYATGAALRAIEETCVRRGIDADVVRNEFGHHLVRRKLTEHPLVSIIIPTRGKIGSLWGFESPYVENFILSAVSTSTYKNVEFLVVYDKETEYRLLERISSLHPSIRLIEYSAKFNFSKKCNLGSIHSKGEILIFANDDLEVITPEWIERLISFLEDPEVGAVGPLLLYENGLVQSAGHLNTGPQNFRNGRSIKEFFDPSWPLFVNREVSGVTGACLAMRKETFYEVGGFSEIFAENFNDVDLCLKLIDNGLRIIWTPDCSLYHFEFKTRSRISNPEEDRLLDLYWGRLVGNERTDPYVQ